MVAILPPHHHQENLQSKGGSPELYKKIREINRLTQISNVDPIYTLTHLAIKSGLPLRVLLDLIEDLNSFYVDFKIKKKSKSNSTKLRSISAPQGELLVVQRCILGAIAETALVSDHAYAYVPRRSAYDAAIMHVGARLLIRFDIKDFFNNISSARIFRIFRSLGYPRLLAFQMTILSTRGLDVKVREDSDSKDALYAISGQGYLPQGAPTSGVLSNIVFAEMDEELVGLSMSFGAVYTRYADDFHLSFSRKISPDEVSEIISSVNEIIFKGGFTMNADKIQVQRNSQSLRMLGLSISSKSVSIGAPYKRKILGLLHAIEKYGLANVAERHNCRTDVELAVKLSGHFSYIFGVDRSFAMKIGGRVKAITDKVT